MGHLEGGWPIALKILKKIREPGIKNKKYYFGKSKIYNLESSAEISTSIGGGFWKLSLV